MTKYTFFSFNLENLLNYQGVLEIRPALIVVTLTCIYNIYQLKVNVIENGKTDNCILLAGRFLTVCIFFYRKHKKKRTAEEKRTASAQPVLDVSVCKPMEC